MRGRLVCGAGTGHMYWHLDELFPDYFDADQLYDLPTDPLELHDQAGDPHYGRYWLPYGGRWQRLAELPNPFHV